LLEAVVLLLQALRVPNGFFTLTLCGFRTPALIVVALGKVLDALLDFLRVLTKLVVSYF